MADATTGDTKGGNAAAPAGSTGTADLDRLLKEYTDGGGTAPKTDLSTVKPLVDALKPLAEYVEGKRAEDMATAAKKSVDDAVAFVKTDEALKGAPSKIVAGYLQNRYTEDASFKNAYDNRTKDPKGWEAAQTAARDDLKKEIGPLSGSSLRSDVEAATAAVRGARSTPASGEKLDPGELRKMSDTQFAAFKADQEAKQRRRV